MQEEVDKKSQKQDKQMQKQGKNESQNPDKGMLPRKRYLTRSVGSAPDLSKKLKTGINITESR